MNMFFFYDKHVLLFTKVIVKLYKIADAKMLWFVFMSE